jgi:hypothetical protein
MTGRLAFWWDKKNCAMRPVNKTWAKRCDDRFFDKQVYWLDEEHERSEASHNQQFAWLAEAWKHLPEDLAEEYPTPLKLRKRALILAGWYDEQIIDAGTNDAALRVAEGIKLRDELALIFVRDQYVLIRTAKSQARSAMKSKEFQESKQKVLEIVAGMIGVTPEALLANTGEAA